MYIGLTSKKLDIRLKQHINSSLKEKDNYTKKENWIRNRTFENIKIEIILLEENLSKENAIELEISYISKYKLSNLTNLTLGGEGVFGYKYSKQQKLNWYNSIKVDQYSLDGIYINSFQTITECSDFLNISHSSVFYCITNKNITSHGYIFIEKDDKEILYEKLATLKESELKLKLYDLYGNLIKVYKSANDIYKDINASQSLTEFSKRLNDGIVPIQLKQKYFILYPNFNLNVMLTSLNRYKIYNGSEVIYFISTKDIAKYLLCPVTSVTDVISKIRKSVKGWQIFKHDEDIVEYKKNNTRKVAEIDSEGNIIKTFNSIKSCSDFYNIDSSGITKVCRGVRKKVNKRIFKYIDDIV